MNIKKGKLLVIVLFLFDILITMGVISVKSLTFKTGIGNDSYRILLDLIVISLAFTGIPLMKGIYMAILCFTGLIYIIISVGIFISENSRMYGLALLTAGIYYIAMFFMFAYTRSIKNFFDDQQKKFRVKYIDKLG